MKFKKSIIFINMFFVFFLSISGCAPISHNNDVKNQESSVYRNNAIEFPQEDLTNSNTKIAIYDISRDDFHLFIENPSQENFRTEDCTIYEYVEGQRFFASNGSQIFEMDTEFVEFVNNKSLINDFLLEHNIVGEIRQVITFWAPNVPITTWVKIDNQNIFLMVENVSNEPSNYQFSIINYNEYYQKYASKKASLIVNGNNVSCSNTPKIYGEYCEIPFLATLEALGATIKWKNNSNVKITYGDVYYFDTENQYIYKWSLQYKNLLSGLSGTHFYYPVDNDVMIDDSLFKYIVRAMGKEILINIDREHSIISVRT